MGPNVESGTDNGSMEVAGLGGLTGPLAVVSLGTGGADCTGTVGLTASGRVWVDAAAATAAATSGLGLSLAEICAMVQRSPGLLRSAWLTISRNGSGRESGTWTSPPAVSPSSGVRWVNDSTRVTPRAQMSEALENSPWAASGAV